jgi:hypothetical protein
MSTTYIDGLPAILDSDGTLSLCVSGPSAFVRCARFIARISLPSGNIDWLVERSPTRMTDSVYRLTRKIDLFGSGYELWVSEQNHIVAELIPTECGAMNIAALHAATGTRLWEQFVAIPDAADWAEATPAWPGAQTEEIDAFIAKDPNRLVVCMARQTRRSGIYTPTYEVTTLPPYACQTDATRLDLSTGNPMWRADFQDVHVGIIERQSFTGIWSRSPRLGVINFESGTNTIVHELPHSLGWPVRDGLDVAVPWHSKGEVGIEWIDERGRRVRNGAWRQPRVVQTYVHPTEAGLGMQTNDQSFWWLGRECLPAWSVRAKPYIYRVRRAPDTDVFIGTDGNGGRLLALDAHSGRETLNLKPVLGGVGDLAKTHGHKVLVSAFRVSRSYSSPPRLLVLSMSDRRHRLDHECSLLLGTWEHGVICRAGRDGERIAIIDIRSSEQPEA